MKVCRFKLLFTAAGLLGVVTLSLALAGQPALADGDDDAPLAIFNITGDSEDFEIEGQGFPADPMVTLNGTDVSDDIVTNTSTSIVISTGAPLDPGSYRVTVGEFDDSPECFDDSDDCFEYTVGAGDTNATLTTTICVAGRFFPPLVIVPSPAQCGSAIFCALTGVGNLAGQVPRCLLAGSQGMPWSLTATGANTNCSAVCIN